jgi:hypothetical protein
MKTNTWERVADMDEASFDSQIREIVRNDNVPIRSDPAEANESAASNVSSLVERVAGVSLQEIDNLIVELQNLRDFLVSEGERIQREIAGYGRLSRAALRSAKITTSSLPSMTLTTDESRSN